MFDILEFYKFNLGFKNLIYKKFSKRLKFLLKSIIIMLIMIFIKFFYSLSDNKFDWLEIVILLILTLLYLVIRSVYGNKIMKDLYRFDSYSSRSKLGKFLFNKNGFIKLESSLLKEHIGKFDIISSKQIEAYISIVQGFRETNKTRFGLSTAITIAFVSSIMTIFLSQTESVNSLMIGISVMVFMILMFYSIEKNTLDIIHTFNITSESKYLRIINLLHVIIIFNELPQKEVRETYYSCFYERT